MRKIWLLMTVAVVAAGLTVLGCAQSSEDAADTAADTTPAADATPAADSHAADDGHGHGADDGHGHSHGADDGHGHGDTQMASMTLDGTLGCGHCTYKTTEGCSVALQTADGQVYVVEGGDQAALMDVRMDQPVASVSGKVTTRDGLKIIQVESYNLN